MVDEACPQIRLDVMPRVEADLHDVLMERRCIVGHVPRNFTQAIYMRLDQFHEESLA